MLCSRRGAVVGLDALRAAVAANINTAAPPAAGSIVVLNTDGSQPQADRNGSVTLTDSVFAFLRTPTDVVPLPYPPHPPPLPEEGVAATPEDEVAACSAALEQWREVCDDLFGCIAEQRRAWLVLCSHASGYVRATTRSVEQLRQRWAAERQAAEALFAAHDAVALQHAATPLLFRSGSLADVVDLPALAQWRAACERECAQLDTLVTSLAADAASLPPALAAGPTSGEMPGDDAARRAADAAVAKLRSIVSAAATAAAGPVACGVVPALRAAVAAVAAECAAPLAALREERAGVLRGLEAKAVELSSRVREIRRRHVVHVRAVDATSARLRPLAAASGRPEGYLWGVVEVMRRQSFSELLTQRAAAAQSELVQMVREENARRAEFAAVYLPFVGDVLPLLRIAVPHAEVRVTATAPVSLPDAAASAAVAAVVARAAAGELPTTLGKPPVMLREWASSPAAAALAATPTSSCPATAVAFGVGSGAGLGGAPSTQSSSAHQAASVTSPEGAESKPL